MGTEDLRVREALATDAEAIARVHVRTWQSAYRGQVPDEFLDALTEERRVEGWQQVLGDRDRDETNWVAERARELIGFAGAGASRDQDADPQTGELFAIYVLAEHWGTGAGRALMHEATGWLRERFGVATLWVLDTNERARRFYEAGGWAPDGARKDDDRGSFVLREVRYRVEL